MSEATIVYVVMEGESGEGGSVAGVFSSLLKANSCIMGIIVTHGYKMEWDEENNRWEDAAGVSYIECAVFEVL